MLSIYIFILYLNILYFSDFERDYYSKQQTANDKLQYALLLMKSNENHKLQSIDIFTELLTNINENPELFDNTTNPTLILDVLYNLALVLYSLKNYADSRTYCEDLLGIFPDNQQVLYDYIIFIYSFYCTVIYINIYIYYCTDS